MLYHTRISSALWRILLPPFLVLGAVGLQPQQYPTRPVRLVVPYPPGGANDVVARLITDELARWGKVIKSLGITPE